MADVTKLTVVGSGEGKQPKANVNAQQTVAWGSEVDFTLQLQKASCNPTGDARELEQEAAAALGRDCEDPAQPSWGERWK